MDEEFGELVVDEAALAATAHRLVPVVGEIDAALAEVDSILLDLRRRCNGHPSGAGFDSAQTAMARTTETRLRAVREAIVALSDNMIRTCAEFGDADATAAGGLGRRQC